MSYIQTIAEIRSAAEAVNEGRFDHGRRVDFSQGFDNKFPFIWLYPVDINDAGINDTVDSTTILMGFWDQDKPSSSTAEREQLIAKMDALCTAFLAQLGLNYQAQATGISREPQYQHSQGHVSGMALRFTYQNFTPCE